MKNKKILKKLIALVCATTILAGGMTVLPKDSNVANAADVPAGLEGYTRIGLEYFGITTEKEHVYAGTGYTKPYLASKSIEPQAYFEADIAMTDGAAFNTYIAYLDANLFQIYVNGSGGTLYVYYPGTGDTIFLPTLSNYGASVGSYFNLKLATNMVDNPDDTSKTDVTVYLYINNQKVNPTSTGKNVITVSDKLANGKELIVQQYMNSTIKIRPAAPAEPADSKLPNALADGYKRVTPDNFKIYEEKVHQFKTGDTGYYKQYTGSNKYNTTKAYFEAEIAITNGQANNTYIAYLDYQFIQIYVNTSNNLYIYSYKGSTNTLYNVNLNNYGVKYGEYFNLKLATDMVASATANKTDVKIQAWVNNQSIGTAKTFNISTSYADGTELRVQQYKPGTIKIKQPVIECVIEYDDISQYRKNGNVAPTAPDGYIFAGWFTKETCELNEAISPTITSGSAYAKFIDKHLLRIQAQIPADTKDEEGATSKLRFVTSIDSLNYNKVGFTITTNANDKTYGGFDNIVYDKLTVTLNGDGTNDTVLGYTPRRLFGSTAVYYKAWIIEGIPNVNYDSEFYATPYLETLDGTTVYGTTATKTVRMGLSQ